MKLKVITNSRTRSVAAISRILSLSRPTIYKRIELQNWTDYEIKILKKQNLL